MSYTNGLDKPSDYFNTKLYTGTGSSNAVTGVGFEPSFTWIKNRGGNNFQNLYDVIRGATKTLCSATTAAESTSGSGLTAFGTDGFTVVSDGDVNASSNPYVSWNWVAGTSFTNDASSTGIGTIDSAGSVNQDSGFSIVSWTGTGSAGTIKHGLNSAPSMIIIKNRSSVYDWTVGHNSLGWTNVVFLNLTTASQSDTQFNNTAPTSSVFSIGTPLMANKSGDSIIAYCFAEKQGYSKFSSYIGNGSASSGTFTYLGFKPSLIILKRTDSTADWKMYDNKRNSGSITNGNPNGRTLKPNSNAAEGNAELLDFLSNGFKHYNDNGTDNESGATYIYMAFAENPFVTGSSGIPATAR